jgi:hypothetical protein
MQDRKIAINLIKKIWINKNLKNISMVLQKCSFNSRKFIMEINIMQKQDMNFPRKYSKKSKYLLSSKLV